jgi:Tfp pilus assembly protein PilF
METLEHDAAAAEAMQRQALDMVRGLGGFPVLQARIHNNIGVILSCTGKNAEAGAEFARALTLVEGRVDPQSQFCQVIARNHSRAAAATR